MAIASTSAFAVVGFIAIVADERPVRIAAAACPLGAAYRTRVLMTLLLFNLGDFPDKNRATVTVDASSVA
jgi:hypothetical protein